MSSSEITVMLLLVVAAAVVTTVCGQETVTQAALEAASACQEPGAVPHPSDQRRLVVCGGPGRLVAVVLCPEDSVASADSATCVPQTHARALSARARRQAGAGAGAERVGCEGGPPGLRCAGCDALLVCAAEGGRVRAIANISCSGGAGPAGDGALACDPALHACALPAAGVAPCAAAAASASGLAAFRCLQPGAFPDPDDCRRYHLCEVTSLDHYSDVCEIAYDPDKSICVTEGDTCDPKTSLPPACSSNAAAATFPGHPSFYRVCLPQTPKGYRSAVLRCPDQQVFDAKTGACTYVCDGKKNRFPDPLDCHAFFDCPGDSATPTVPKRGLCAQGLAYDVKRHMCVQEASVSTCVREIFPAPAQPTPAVLAPAVTVPPMKPGSPADVPGRCTQEGVYPDPYECRRYVTCSRSRTGALVRTVRYCPIFTSFSVSSNSCWFDFCF